MAEESELLRTGILLGGMYTIVFSILAGSLFVDSRIRKRVLKQAERFYSKGKIGWAYLQAMYATRGKTPNFLQIFNRKTNKRALDILDKIEPQIKNLKSNIEKEIRKEATEGVEIDLQAGKYHFGFSGKRKLSEISPTYRQHFSGD